MLSNCAKNKKGERECSKVIINDWKQGEKQKKLQWKYENMCTRGKTWMHGPKIKGIVAN